MRHAAAAILGMALLGTAAPPAFAASAEVWQGVMFVQTVTGACTMAGVTSVGDYYVTVYRPIISGTQIGPEGLSFIGGRSAQLWTTLSSTSSFHNSAVANILVLSSHAGSALAASAGGYSLTILPHTILANTPSVTITGLLSTFWNVPGCNVTVAASLEQRP